MAEKIDALITPINDILYYPVLIILLLGIGIYFTLKTGFLQGRLFKESVRVVMEKPEEDDSVSSFQALMVSTASRVGTGNIVGVSSRWVWCRVLDVGCCHHRWSICICRIYIGANL